MVRTIDINITGVAGLRRTARDAGFDESKHPRTENGQFGSGSRLGSDHGEWHTKSGERRLPTNEESVVQSPIPLSNTDLQKARGAGVAEAVKSAPTQTVHLADLSTMQPQVAVSKLREFSDDAPPVSVVKWRGDMILIDGNHRVSSAWVAGRENVQARVLDLDDKKNSQYLKPEYR